MMPFTFRHFEPQTDLYQLLRLYGEVESTDRDGKGMSEARLREQIASPGHDPRQDCWVVEAAEAPDALIAFSGLWKAPESDHADIIGIVHPAWRRKSIGRVLMSRTLIRARAVGAAQVRVYVEARNQPAVAFLREHRFQPEGAYTLMRAPGDIPMEAPNWPAGFHVRTYDAVKQLPLLTDAMNRCYDGLWGHNVVTEDDLATWLQDWAPDGIFLIFDAGGEVAGVCRAVLSRQRSAERGEPTGYIDAPGVLPWRRRQGLYMPLLATAVRFLRSRQPAAIELESWGDDDQTLELYEQAGFGVARRSVLYRLNLR
jgi:ribosomal protein S18 acetylase RimI-like enzyme